MYIGWRAGQVSGLHFAPTREVATRVYLENTIWSILVVTYLVTMRKHFLYPKREN